MNKRRGALFLFFIVLLIIPIVKAQNFNLGSPEEFMRNAIEGVKMVFRPILEALLGEGTSDEFFFSKILLLILIFSIITLSLKRVTFFESHKGVIFVVAGVVSLFGVRFISEESVVAGILLPYGALAIAITTFLPFMIYFWFVHDAVQGSYGRRIAWILYGLVFILLWFTRRDQISGFSETIYLFGLIAVLVSLFFDHSIHSYFGTARSEKMKRGFKLKQIADIEADLHKFRAIPTPTRETQNLIRQLEYKHAQLLRDL